MLEPEIKYESCEEIFTESRPGGNNGSLALAPEGGNHGGVLGDGGCGGDASTRLKRNYNDHLQSMIASAVGVGGGGGDAIALTEPFPNHNFPISANYYSAQTMPAPTLDVTKVKRQRRSESNILFSHPFFNLQEDWDSMRPGETITAKCLSCKVILRGHKNVSSNFIKHMKRLHPELYKVYENYKLLKFKGYTPADTTSCSTQSTPNNGVSAEHSFFDANAFLEHMTSTVEEHNLGESSITPPTPLGGEQLHSYDCGGVSESPRLGFSNGGGGSGVRLVSQEKIIEPKQTTEVELSAKTMDKMAQILGDKIQQCIAKVDVSEEKKPVVEDKNMGSHSAGSNATPPKADISNENPPTDNSSLQAQINALKRECVQLRSAVQKAQQSKRQLQQELQLIDKTIRQRKIIMRNVKLLDAEKPKQAAERLLREHLQLTDIPLANVSIMTKKHSKNNLQNLLIEVQKSSDSNAIFNNCFKLKNTGIVVEQNLSPSALRRKNKLLVLRREILRRNPQLNVNVRNTQLIVGGKRFFWDDVDGLCVFGLSPTSDGLNDEGKESAAETLKATTGLNLDEFLNVLRNYDIK